MARLDVPTLIVSDAAAFRAWLDANRDRSEGVWLVLAKKGVTDPTSLTYAQALEEALCQGWIDGQKRSRDATTFAQRFTPRRRTSQELTRECPFHGRSPYNDKSREMLANRTLPLTRHDE